MELVLLGEVCVAFLPSGENLTSRFSFTKVQVKVTRRRLPVDLIMLEIVDSSMVLGMEQLSRYNVPFLCRSKRTMFQPFVGEVFDCKGTPRESKWLIMSALKANRALLMGYVGYLASTVGTTRR